MTMTIRHFKRLYYMTMTIRHLTQNLIPLLLYKTQQPNKG
jgi:hypothetical protein